MTLRRVKLNPPGRLGILIGLLGAVLAHAATQGAGPALPTPAGTDLVTYGGPAVFGMALAYFAQRLVTWGVERAVRSFEEMPGKMDALREEFDKLTAQLRVHQAREEEWQRAIERRVELLEQDVRNGRNGRNGGANGAH